MKKRQKRKVRVQKTENYLLIQNVCTQCYENEAMGLVSGKSGIGKSTALRAFASKNSGVVYYEVEDDTPSRKNLLEDILYTVGGVMVTKSIADLKRQIVKELKNSKIDLLIIDQANYLKVSQFNMLNAIREKSGVSLVLVGTEKLPSILANANRSLELEQFYTRIDFAQAAKPISFESVSSFLVSGGFPPPPKIDKESSEDELEKAEEFRKIVSLLYNEGKNRGQLRTVSTLIERAKQLQKRRKDPFLSFDHFKFVTQYLI